jgi:hypothetical protein
VNIGPNAGSSPNELLAKNILVPFIAKFLVQLYGDNGESLALINDWIVRFHANRLS